ncbi:MAG: DoxX family protein [Armatimonadota bacterium]
MFLFTASAHFTRMKEDLVAMVPAWVPQPRLMVTITGILEILSALGLLLAPLSRLSAFALILLLMALFPANVHAAANRIPLRGRSPTPLWLRLPLQVLYAFLLWWSTR